MSSVLFEQIWHILDVRLRHLLLMMDSDCPLAFRHKKGKYILTLVGGDTLLSMFLVSLLIDLYL